MQVRDQVGEYIYNVLDSTIFDRVSRKIRTTVWLTLSTPIRDQVMWPVKQEVILHVHDEWSQHVDAEKRR